MNKYTSFFLIFLLPAFPLSVLTAEECSDQNITGIWKDRDITWEINKNGSIICSCNNCYCGDPVERTIPARRGDIVEITCKTYEGKPISWKLNKQNEIIIFFTKGFAIMKCTANPKINGLQFGEIILKAN